MTGFYSISHWCVVMCVSVTIFLRNCNPETLNSKFFQISIWEQNLRGHVPIMEKFQSTFVNSSTFLKNFIRDLPIIESSASVSPI